MTTTEPAVRCYTCIGMEFDLPDSCPFIVRKLQIFSKSSSYYLIREHDRHGEYPNIFAKVCQMSEDPLDCVVFLSDTGVGTDVLEESLCDRSDRTSDPAGSELLDSSPSGCDRWNIASVMAHTINPEHHYPYMILTTHCHFDHILGIGSLQQASTNINVLSSSYQKSYITPYEARQKHSLCTLFGDRAPEYHISWVKHGSRLKYDRSDPGPDKGKFDTNITVLHTPGHTPDSLAWYDYDLNVLSVGDTFYERESKETNCGSGKWPREPPQPVILVHDSDLSDWMMSMNRLIGFVEKENRRRAEILSTPIQGSTNSQDEHRTLDHENIDGVSLQSDCGEDWLILNTENIPSHRVKLSAAHVTICTDALTSLLAMKRFMERVVKGEVPKKRVDSFDKRDEVWLWDDCIGTESESTCSTSSTPDFCRFSVQAPISVIHRLNHGLFTRRDIK